MGAAFTRRQIVTASAGAPGLGLALNDPVVREHLRYQEYFVPSTMFDRWSYCLDRLCRVAHGRT